MSMAALRLHLYSTPIPLYEEAQFNVLHATYSLIHVHPQLNEDVLVKANNMFTILLQRYFKTDLQVLLFVVVVILLLLLFCCCYFCCYFVVVVKGSQCYPLFIRVFISC